MKPGSNIYDLSLGSVFSEKYLSFTFKISCGRVFNSFKRFSMKFHRKLISVYTSWIDWGSSMLLVFYSAFWVDFELLSSSEYCLYIYEFLLITFPDLISIIFPCSSTVSPSSSLMLISLSSSNSSISPFSFFLFLKTFFLNDKLSPS